MSNNEPKAPSSPKLGRRTFLQAGSLFGIGSLLLPRTLFAKGSIAGGGCDPTSDDILGPFYLPGSPVTTQVALPGEPGTRLFINGSVLANDCLSPIEGASIEVWQANDAAVYDNTQDFNLRATMYSDANGNYAFETIMPGPYLNGAQFRPKHIHFRVNKPGFPELITQLYFEGDPFIAADPWASQADAAARIIPLNTTGPDQLEGQFDIVLDGSVGIKPNRYGTDGDLMPLYPNPMTDRCSIHFNVFHHARVELHITDLHGSILATLISGDQAPGRYTTQWDGRSGGYGTEAPAGIYLVHLIMDGVPVKAQRIVRQ